MEIEQGAAHTIKIFPVATLKKKKNQTKKTS